MKLLITGFEPFGGETMNPAYEAVKLLPKSINGAEIITMEIPTVFGKCGEAIEKKIMELHPDVVLCVGQAGGRSAITVEKVAINYADGRIADNDGYQPTGEIIQPDGETAYFATLPIKDMVTGILAEGIPANISYSAGTYVCNDVMYRLLYLLHTKYTQIRGGFIHVPFAPQQVAASGGNYPSMEMTTIARGLQAAITVIVRGKEDSAIAMGTTE
ncbi:MAG: pyroglutamyl-peptidase I [Lachnospiraceae bacterium]